MIAVPHQFIRHTLPIITAVFVLALSAPVDGQKDDTNHASPTKITPATVHQGSGSTAVPPLDSVPLGGVSARGAALLLSGLSGGDVRGAMTWAIVGNSAASTDTSMVFVIEVDGDSLLGNNSSQRVPIELYGYLVDVTGAVVGHLSEGVLLETPTLRRTMAASGLKFIGKVHIPPGMYSLRVVVRNRTNGNFFLSRQDIQVPEWDSSELFVLPPLVQDPSANWIIALQPGIDDSSIDQIFPGLSTWPSARPVWDSTEPLEMIVGSPELETGLTVRASLLDAAGRTVGEPELVPGERVLVTSAAHHHRMSISPPDVPQGEYRMVIELSDTDTGHTALRSLTLDVHEGENDLSWAELGERGPVLRVARPAASEAAGKEGVTKGEMIAAYDRALRLLATGDAVAARRELADLELRVMETRSSQRINQLQSAEIKRAVQLAKSSPNTSLAVTLFHRDMYRWYASRRRTVLSGHAWHVVTEVMNQVAKSKYGMPLAGFREAVILDQASDLAREGEISGARRLLEGLMEIAPDNFQARLGLAALCERTGDPKGAVENLQPLLEVQPDNAEARLRLAVNQIRVGSRRSAVEHLRALLAQETPQWVRALTYQELGRLLVERRRVAEGEILLRRAVDEMPRNQRLRILHAHALDAQQRPWEATQVIEELDSRGGQQSTSPRLRYAQWPDLDLARAQAILARAQELGIRALEEAFE